MNFNAKKPILIALFLFLSLFSAVNAQVLKLNKKGDSVFLMLPDTLLNQDLLLGARVVSLSRQYNISAGLTLKNPIVVRFAKSKRGGRIEMLQMTTKATWDENEPAKAILERNNVWPVLAVFKSKKEDAGISIDVSLFFSGEIGAVTPLPRGIKQGHLEKSVSGILRVQSLENRVNVVTRLVYTGGKYPLTTELCYTLMVLPKVPMHPRRSDERVNFFDSAKRLYDTKGPVESVSYAHRWRIEPKEGDRKRWEKGECVVPAKPIVFYFDSATPPMIKKYAKQGILAWNEAFKPLGFKRVLQVKDFPKGKFLAEDMGVNVFRYIPNTRANASGPCWVDPRSGEIIQAEIIWWHNVIQLLQTWRFIQTAAVDSLARLPELPEEVMGPMIRYAVAHETGHTLGLKHNFRGSYCYPADSLRSPEFTRKFGTSSSIMDYARFNFVAQPGDLKRGVQLLPPLLGVQDKFAIRWGYSSTKGMSLQQEKVFFKRLFAKHAGDTRFLHAPSESRPITLDPSAQSEQLGNNLLVSTDYGIRNLKVTMMHLVEWTTDTGESYERMQRMYTALVKQFYSFLRADAAYLGGVYHYAGVAGEHKRNYEEVPLKEQKEALHFVIRQMREAPFWLSDALIRPYVGRQKEYLQRQTQLMRALTDVNFLIRMDDSSYGVEDYLKEMTFLLFENHKGNNYEKMKNDRTLQLSYIRLLEDAFSQVKKKRKELSSGVVIGLAKALDGAKKKAKKTGLKGVFQ